MMNGEYRWLIIIVRRHEISDDIIFSKYHAFYFFTNHFTGGCTRLGTRFRHKFLSIPNFERLSNEPIFRFTVIIEKNFNRPTNNNNMAKSPFANIVGDRRNKRTARARAQSILAFAWFRKLKMSTP